MQKTTALIPTGRWANTLYQNAENISKRSRNGSIINACFNPDFANCLKKQLISYLPLWTGIMRCHFEGSSIIATSSSVESEFNDLKRRAFDIKLPMRIDKFVLHHLDYLDGKVKLASNERDLLLIEERDLKGRKINNKNKSESRIQSSRESEFNFTTSGLETSDYESHKNMENTQHDNGIDIPHDDSETLQISYEEQKSTETEIECTEHGNEIEIWNDNSEASPVVHEQLKSIECNNISNFINDETDADCDDSLTNSFMDNIDIQSSTANDCDIWNTCENWRGKAEKESRSIAELKESPIKKRAKPSYLDACPEWEYIKDAKVSKLPVFKNGLFCKPVIMGKFGLNLKNTCAFDSLFQVIMNAIASNQVYYEILEKSNNQTIRLTLKILTGKKKLTMVDYRERADILSKMRLFKMESFTRTIKRMDTECNVAHLAQYILEDIPSHKTKVLCQCGYNFDTQSISLSINIDLILCNGFGFVQQAIDDRHKTKRTCRKCGILIEDEIQHGPHVIIDTSIVTDDRYTTRNKDISYALDSITKIIEIKDRIYSLAGVVSWSAGHYIGYTKSGMYWHEYNDIEPSCDSVNPSKTIRPHLILYVISNKNINK